MIPVNVTPYSGKGKNSLSVGIILLWTTHFVQPSHQIPQQMIGRERVCRVPCRQALAHQAQKRGEKRKGMR